MSEPRFWDEVVDLRPKPQRLLTTDLFIEQAAAMFKEHSMFEEVRKLSELRKSCGIKPEKTSRMHVSLPPRYRP